MKKKFPLTVVSIAVVLMLIFSASCRKKTKLTTPVIPDIIEEFMAFNIDPDPGIAVASSLGGTYPFKVEITSRMPVKGVKLEMTTKKDSDNSMLDSKTLESSTNKIDLTTSTLLPGVVYNVTIVITSKGKAANTKSRTFKVARK